MNKGHIFTALVAAYACTRATSSEAERIADIMNDRYNQGLYVVYNWANEGGDPQYDYMGYDLDKAKKALVEADRVDGYEHIEQTWYLEERTTFNNHTIDSRDIDAINESTDELLYDVRGHFGGKYTTYTDEDGDTVTLRIADHSGNCYNNQGGRCISIVIANSNATARFQQSSKGIAGERFYDDDYTADEIIDDITAALLEEGIVADFAC